MVDLHDDPLELVDSRCDAWRTRYATERDRLQGAFADADVSASVRAIEHVGSTAVRDLPAKDIVDLDVVVDDDAVGAVSRAVTDALSSTRYENGATWHVLARRSDDGQRFNVHVFGASDDGWRESVATRDVLRSRPDLRDAYADRKRELAAANDDVGAYSRGKTDVLDRILRTARDADDLEFDFAVPVDD